MNKNKFYKLAALQIFIIAICIYLLYDFGSSKGMKTNEKKLEEIDRLLGHFVQVKGSAFFIGSPADSKCPGLKGQKNCNLSTFSIQDAELTKALYNLVMHDSLNRSDESIPISDVSWDDIQVFISKLNDITGKHYRLPTEFEWEYAARGGENPSDDCYSGGNDIESVGWFDGNSKGQVHPIKQKIKNRLGLYDMTGNVSEWCSNYYNSEILPNCQIPDTGDKRSIRGGSFVHGTYMCIVTQRQDRKPSDKHVSIGFRLVEQ